jgi:hypothetical protein
MVETKVVRNIFAVPPFTLCHFCTRYIADVILEWKRACLSNFQTSYYIMQSGAVGVAGTCSFISSGYGDKMVKRILGI